MTNTKQQKQNIASLKKATKHKKYGAFRASTTYITNGAFAVNRADYGMEGASLETLGAIFGVEFSDMPDETIEKACAVSSDARVFNRSGLVIESAKADLCVFLPEKGEGAPVYIARAYCEAFGLESVLSGGPTSPTIKNYTDNGKVVGGPVCVMPCLAPEGAQALAWEYSAAVAYANDDAAKKESVG